MLQKAAMNTSDNRQGFTNLGKLWSRESDLHYRTDMKGPDPTLCAAHIDGLPLYGSGPRSNNPHSHQYWGLVSSWIVASQKSKRRGQPTGTGLYTCWQRFTMCPILDCFSKWSCFHNRIATHYVTTLTHHCCQVFPWKSRRLVWSMVALVMDIVQDYKYVLVCKNCWRTNKGGAQRPGPPVLKPGDISMSTW